MGPFHRAVATAFHEAPGAGADWYRDPLLKRALDALDGVGDPNEALFGLEELARGSRDARLAQAAGVVRAGAPPAEEPRPYPEPADPGDEVEWPALFEPFEAEGGFVVECARSEADLGRVGRALDNALSMPAYAQAYAVKVAEGDLHVYVVKRDGKPVSTGEIVPGVDGPELRWNRGVRNGMPDPRSTLAAERLVDGLRAGSVPSGWEIHDGSFVPSFPPARPGG